MDNTVSLSTNAIPYILSLQANENAYKEPITINESKLQIEDIKIKASSKEDFMLLSLSDGVNKSNTFYIEKKDNNFQIGDIIQISSIIFMKVNNTMVLTFIKKMEHLYSSTPINNNNNNDNKNKNEDNEKNDNEYEAGKYNSLSTLSTFIKSFRIYIGIISKNEIRKFKNPTGEGKVLTFIMRDKDGFEMQGVSFGEACEKVNNQINIGNFYETTSGMIRLTQKKGYSNLSEYSIQFFEDAKFKQMPPLCSLDDSHIPLDSIKDIQNLYINTFVNILGVVIKQGNVYPIKIRKNNSLQNTKTIVIGDESGEVIELRIWGNKSTDNYEQGSIFLFTKLRVNEYKNVKSLNTTDDSLFFSNPKIPQVETFKQYLSKKGKFPQIKNTNSFEQINDFIQGEKLFLNQIYDKIAEIDSNHKSNKSNKSINKNLIFTFEAVVVFINKYKNNYYYGCPNKNCKKKLKIIDRRNVYYCTKCNNDIKDNEGEFYYTVMLKVRDCTMESRVDLYGDIAENLMGVDCKTYHEYGLNNKAAINEIHKKILNKKHLFISKIYKKSIDSYLYETKLQIIQAFEITNEIQTKLSKTKCDFIKSLNLINH